jgi:hypothetical protein
MIEISQYFFIRIINLLKYHSRCNDLAYINKIHLMEEGKLSNHVNIPIKH